MANKKLSIDELRKLIETGEAGDPLVFLESVMNGFDPRHVSSLFLLVMEIEDMSDGQPDMDDWKEVVDLVKANYRLPVVGLGESMAAGKTIAEYLHAKRKQVELTGIGDGTAGKPAPLDEEEIILFMEVWNDTF